MSNSLESILTGQMELIKQSNKIDCNGLSDPECRKKLSDKICKILHDEEEKMLIITNFYFFERLSVPEIVTLLSNEKIKNNLDVSGEVFTEYNVYFYLQGILAKLSRLLCESGCSKFSAANFTGMKKEERVISGDPLVGKGLDITA